MRTKGGVYLTRGRLRDAFLFLCRINAAACPRCGGFGITLSQDGEDAVCCDRCEKMGIICGTCKTPVRFTLDDEGVVLDTGCCCNK